MLLAGGFMCQGPDGGEDWPELSFPKHFALPLLFTPQVWAAQSAGFRR